MSKPLVVPAPNLPHWAPLAASQPAGELRISSPIENLISEAADLARFVADHWQTKRDGDTIVTPGLQMVNRHKSKLRFTDDSATELLGLMATVQAAQTTYVLTVGPKGSGDVRDAARHDLSELQGAIEQVLDDGVEDDNDRRLAKLDDAHHEPTNDDTLASALADYAGLARDAEIYPELQELAAGEGFDLGTVARCEQHANTLRLLPATPRPKGEEELRAFEQRNRLVNLLQQQLRLIRGAARWVFRDHPKVARLATSAYERRQRAEARRKKAAAATTSGQP